MLDKGLVAVQSSGLFTEATKERHALALANVAQIWVEFKQNFTAAYDVWLVSGEGIAASACYNGTVNTINDDTSISTIETKAETSAFLLGGKARATRFC